MAAVIVFGNEIRVRRPRSGSWRSQCRVLHAALGIVLLAVGSIAAVTPAAAWVDVPETGIRGALVLRTHNLPAENIDLAAGESHEFLIQARLVDASQSSLALQLRATGTLVHRAAGLRISVESCRAAYPNVAAPCPTGGTDVIEHARLADIATESSSGVWALAPLTAAEPRYLKVALFLPADPNHERPASGSVAVGLIATGDTHLATEIPQLPHIAEAGIRVFSVVVVAAGSLLLGLSLRRGTRGMGLRAKVEK